MQKTRLNKLQKEIGNLFASLLLGPWKRRCTSLLSLLFGYYLGSNLTVYFLQRVGQRTFVVFAMFILIEFCVRLRTRIKVTPLPLSWLAADNIRIGTIYSVVLEAFKLGS